MLVLRTDLGDHPPDQLSRYTPGLAFKPALHVNYVETMLPMKDGLPNFRGFPKEVGSTGETVAE